MKTDKKIINLEIGHTVKIDTCPMEAEEITRGIIDQITEVDHDTAIDMMVGKKTIDMMIGEITTGKMKDVTIIGKIIEEVIIEPIIGQIMEETMIGNRDIELEAKVGIILEIMSDNSRERFE